MDTFKRSLLVGLAAFAVGTAAMAQAPWPAKTVRILVPFGAGSGLDVMARGFAERLSEQTRATVIVENRDGAGGTIGALAVAQAPADGYTLMFTAHAPFAVAPYLQEGAGYDPMADFTPISKVALIPMVLITGKNSGFKRFEDVVAAAKARPGKLDYASSGVGTPSHLHVEVLQQKMGLDIAAIPYKSTAQAMTDLVGGQVQLYMPSFPAALGQLKAGQAQALAIGSVTRSKVMPDIPTVAEVTHQPGLQAVVWYGFLAPKGLPEPMAERIHAEIARAAASPQVTALIARIGADAVLVGPKEFRTQVRRDADESRQLLGSLGIKPGK